MSNMQYQNELSSESGLVVVLILNKLQVFWGWGLGKRRGTTNTQNRNELSSESGLAVVFKLLTNYTFLGWWWWGGGGGGGG